MVRFSSSLEDKQPQKRNNQAPDGYDLEYSRETQREIRQRPVYTQEAPTYVERKPPAVEMNDDYDNILDETIILLPRFLHRKNLSFPIGEYLENGLKSDIFKHNRKKIGKIQIRHV